MSRKTKTTATKEEATPALVSKLRFPEFRGAVGWIKLKLGSAAFFYNGRAYKQEELLERGKYRVLRVGNFFTNNNWYYSDLELEDEKYCEEGDLLYAWSASFGPRVWKQGKTIYHYHIWKVVQREGVDKAFLFITLEHQTERMKAESANGLGLLHITKGTIESWEVCFPKVPEQQKIAECLSSVDELIAAQARKVDALKTHKKGLMQQLFPREGETQPRLRFPEFQNAGEWSEEPLDHLAHFQDGFAFKSTDFVKEQDDATQVIRITDINNKNTNEDKVYIPTEFLENNKLGKYRVDDGDLLLSLTGAAGFNFFFWNSGPAAINQRTAKVTSKKKSGHALLRLLEPLIHEKINERGEGQNNNLSKEFLSTIVLRVPEPDEQQRIATCLSSLDALITAETQKHEALKTHKKGLMQQLFPSPEEVAG